MLRALPQLPQTGVQVIGIKIHAEAIISIFNFHVLKTTRAHTWSRFEPVSVRAKMSAGLGSEDAEVDGCWIDYINSTCQEFGVDAAL